MSNMNRPSTNTLAGITKFGIALMLMLALFGMPQKAEACCSPVVSDIPTETATLATKVLDAAGWAAAAEQYAAEAEQWMVDNMDGVLDMVMNVMSQEVQSFSNMTGVQAGVDAQARETQKRFTTDISLQYSMNMPTATATAGGTLGSNTGNNMCNTAMRGEAAMLTGNAVDDLTHSLADMIALSRTSQNALTAQQELADICHRGFIDMSAPGTPFVNNPELQGCQPTAGFTDLQGNAYPPNNYRNADLNPESVVGHNYYTMPVGVQVDNQTGQIILPAAPTAPVPPAGMTTSKEEMDFIAAIYVCKTYSRVVNAPSDAYTQAAVKSSTDTAAHIMSLRYAMAGVDAQNAPCVREVARRTRVPQALNPATGTVLKEMYDAQVSRCEHLANEGIINEANGTPTIDLQECEQHGRSQLEMDIMEHCAYAHPGFLKYTAGRDLTATEMARLATEHGGECGNYIAELNREKVAFDASLRQLAQTMRTYDVSYDSANRPH